MKYLRQIKAVIAGLVLSASVLPAAMADDTEIYTSSSIVTNTSNPNILFVVDTSGSMGSGKSFVKPSYDSGKTYSGSCLTTAVYYVDDGLIPDCSITLDNYFNYSALECDHAIKGYEADDYTDPTSGKYTEWGDTISPKQDGALLLIGTYSDQLAQYDTDATPNRWREISIGTSSDRDFSIECLEDSGNPNADSPEYIADSTEYTSTVPANPDEPHPIWFGGAGNLQLFSGNYVNYVNWEPTAAELEEKSYLEQVQSAVETMVRGNNQVDIGLMRFDSKSAANGGAIQYPILDVGASRNDFFSRLKTLNASGWTPLSEVFYESLLYFGGRSTDYSRLSNPGNQVTSKTTMPGGKIFRSPITGTCDKNYIVLLSDGTPRKDDISKTRQGVLPGFPVGSCSSKITSSSTDDNRDAFDSKGSDVDNCLDELSTWAATNDVLQVENPAYPDADDGDQFITTHTIGFFLSDLDAVQLMEDTAEGGGGDFYQASSEAELIGIFNEIIAAALDVNTTFSSPAVSVNAFNRSVHLNDLYFTLFRPEFTRHWPGNLKKYKLEFKDDVPFIADDNGLNAVDATTGFFKTTAQSFWSSSSDGDDVREGGAVSAFTDSRNVYTYTGSYSDPGSTGVNIPSVAGAALTGSDNAVDTSNTALTDALLGITGFSEKVAGTSYRDTLINFSAGLDALSDYGVVDTYDDARPEMGDPLHSEPTLIQYGETAGVADLAIYTATNDGYLHATDSETGKELFSFIPQELLTNLSTIMENSSGTKTYGLDGSVVSWINDADGDNAITSGGSDHAYIYFTMRRGGKNIYAMDVTDRSAPKFMWVIKGGVGDYAELGDTWSTVNVEKIKDGSTEKTVLIFGGGYDDTQDSAVTRRTDSVGRAVFIADATTGERLWSGGEGGDTSVDDMEYSIPARVKPLDIIGDGYIDRLYVTDMGGQIFRFDIDNNNGDPLASSVTGARIADLADTAEEDNRRFYYPPDVALVIDETGKYNALVIASGFRAHPLNTTIHDRIYMIKDKQTAFTTTYTTDVTEDDLKDVTLNLAGGDGSDDAARDAELSLIQGKQGWYIDLDDEDNPGDWIGEKGLAESLLIEGVAIVTTYTPNIKPADNVCGPALGLGKVFYLDILDATPAFPSSVDVRGERHIELLHAGIPPKPTIIVTKGNPPCIAVGPECKVPDLGLGVRKTYWYEEEK